MKTLIKGLAFGAFMTLSTTAMAAECIAPANPGGGWDFTCRQIGKILYDIKAVDQPVQVTNMAGAGGGLAFATVVNERNDDPDLIIAASSAPLIISIFIPVFSSTIRARSFPFFAFRIAAVAQAL